LTVLSVAAVLGLFGTPCIVGLASRLNPQGMAACSIVIAASFIWSMHSSRMLPMLIGLCTFYSLMSEAGTKFWLMPQVAAEYRLYHAALLFAGWLAYAAWLWRLASLTEEAGDYLIPIQAQSGSATRMERTQANRNIGQLMSRNLIWRWSTDAWHDRLMKLTDKTAGSRRLLRYGFSNAPIEFNALWMAIIMVFAGTIPYWSSSNRSPSAGINMGTLAPFFFMASMVPGQLLAMRRSRMSHELMLPLSRREYIDGLLYALMRSALTSAAFVAVGAAALIAWMPGDLPEPAVLAAYAIIGVALQPYFLGMSIRSALYSSAMGRMAVMMAAILPAMVAASVGVWLISQSYFAPAMALAALITGAGVWMMSYARRTWLAAELA
jgi:hypothetical protein